MSATRVTAPAPDTASGASGGAGADDGAHDMDNTDSDDGDDSLPIYQCISFDVCENVILGGGGILECESCRTRRTYDVGDGVALLAL